MCTSSAGMTDSNLRIRSLAEPRSTEVELRKILTSTLFGRLYQSVLIGWFSSFRAAIHGGRWPAVRKTNGPVCPAAYVMRHPCHPTPSKALKVILDISYQYAIIVSLSRHDSVPCEPCAPATPSF